MPRIIETKNVPLESLKLWEDNPRGITKDGYARLKKQVETLGIYAPLVINEDSIVLSGNMRLKVFQELKIDPVLVTIVEARDKKTMLEYALSANDRAGYYEEEKLAELALSVPELDLGDFSVDLGKPEGLDKLVESLGPEIEEDDFDGTLPDKPRSRPGKIYELGRHRLMCGDATKKEDVEKLMDGAEADMVFTDPPYGVSVNETNWIPGQKRGPAFNHRLTNDELRDDNLVDFIALAFKEAIYVSKNNASFYCFSAPLKAGYDILVGLLRAGIHIQSQVIWVKPSLSLGQADYQWRHEICWYGYLKNKEKHSWFGGRTETTVWEESRERDGSHPTMKPVALPARAIKNSSDKDDIVLDLFGGSGSTLIAAEQTGRTCYMMEIDRGYCDVIRNRFKSYVREHQSS